MPDPLDITRSLHAARDGAADAEARVVDALYDDLRRVAAALFRGERRDHTLQPTALVHEAYLRVFDVTVMRDGDREHALSLATRAMRRALVDHARRHGAERRGGEHRRVALADDGPDAATELALSDVLDLSDVLTRFAELDERAARIAELRLFGGLSTQEAADALGVSVRTAANDWTTARAWMSRALSEE